MTCFRLGLFVLFVVCGFVSVVVCRCLCCLLLLVLARCVLFLVCRVLVFVGCVCSKLLCVRYHCWSLVVLYLFVCDVVAVLSYVVCCRCLSLVGDVVASRLSLVHWLFRCVCCVLCVMCVLEFAVIVRCVVRCALFVARC